ASVPSVVELERCCSAGVGLKLPVCASQKSRTGRKPPRLAALALHGARAVSMVSPIRSLQNLILEGAPLGIVFLEPCFRGFRGGEYLEVVNVTDLFAGVDVDKNGHWSLLSFRCPSGYLRDLN